MNKKKNKPKKGIVTKEIILKKAVELLTEVGLESASVRQIAKLANISSAAAFYHFPTKESLIMEIIYYVVLSNHQKVSTLISIYDNAFERLLKHIQGNLQWAQENKQEAQILLLFYYLGSSNDDFSKMYGEILARARNRIKEHLLAGQRENIFHFKIDVEVLTEIIHNTLVGDFVNQSSSKLQSNMRSTQWVQFLTDLTKYESLKTNSIS